MNASSNAIIFDEIRTCSRIAKDSAGRSVRVIDEADSAEIAKNYARPLVDIFITALAGEILPYRYIRNRDSLSLQEQKKLAESCVAVIGCGGLGGNVLLMLSRIGIGSIIIVDPDIFDESNLNRQAFAVSDTIGMHKTDSAFLAIKSINPGVEVRGFKTAITGSNATEILNGANVVVDALDNLPDRKMLQQVSHQMKLPLVHGAITGFEGQVMTIFPGDSYNLFENDDYNRAFSALSAESIMGVPSITPVFIASLQAMEVVKIILKRGNLLSGRILYSDIELGEFNYFSL